MEREIINIALENLTENTGQMVNIKWENIGPLDGIIRLMVANKKFDLQAEFKKELREHHILQMREYQKEHPNLIVIAEKIFPKLKKQLRDEHIPYLETNGNFFFQKDGICFYLDSNKPIFKKKDKGNRAFTKTGLKVLFHFLMDKNLVNYPQREIAERTGVALGNIPQIIEGLKERGYLLNVNKKVLIWEKRRELLDRWIADFNTELQPKLLKGTYQIKENWKDLDFNVNQTVWGGEPAADIITNHLRPEKFTIYTEENQLALMKKYRLIPNKNGEIKVYEKFWKKEENINIAPPLLIYADLITEGGKRNLETAEIIFNEYIQPIL
jgi:hypothetical protein